MKNWSLILLSALSLFACDQEKESEKIAEQNRKIVDVYFEHFNRHDWKKMADLYVDSAEFKDPSLGNDVVKQSKQQVIKKYSEMSQLFPDLKDSILHVYPSGNHHIIVEFQSTGTAQDQSRFKLPICTIFTIEKGLISQDFTYYDNF